MEKEISYKFPNTYILKRLSKWNIIQNENIYKIYILFLFIKKQKI
jgi:hypothetical protein